MTPAEFRALQSAAGLTNKQAAELLGVSLRTVESWRSGQRGIRKPMAELIRRKMRAKK